MYAVAVVLAADGRLAHSTCECPWNPRKSSKPGSVCKHRVAVLLRYIRGWLGEEDAGKVLAVPDIAVRDAAARGASRAAPHPPHAAVEGPRRRRLPVTLLAQPDTRKRRRKAEPRAVADPREDVTVPTPPTPAPAPPAAVVTAAVVATDAREPRLCTKSLGHVAAWHLAQCPQPQPALVEAAPEPITGAPAACAHALSPVTLAWDPPV